MLIALLLAGAGYAVRPSLRPLAAIIQPGPSQSDRMPAADARFISLDAVRTEFVTGTALFADARPMKAYRSGHIQGAMHLDPNEFDSWSESFFSQFPADTRIIAYCDGAQCPLSSELADQLNQMGYDNVFIFKDGWRLWSTGQLPIAQIAE